MIMILYHGSNVIVNNPIILDQNRNLDFGNGFYTTTNQAQAEDFSVKVFSRKKEGSQIVSVFSFDCDSCLKDCSVLSFDVPDERWLDFVSANRNGTYLGVEYDLIIGPVADDNVYTTLSLYMTEQLTKEETLSRLKVKKLYNQVVFASSKALSFLSFDESYEVKQNE